MESDTVEIEAVKPNMEADPSAACIMDVPGEILQHKIFERIPSQTDQINFSMASSTLELLAYRFAALPCSVALPRTIFSGCRFESILLSLAIC